jgi:hypothetical protein
MTKRAGKSPRSKAKPPAITSGPAGVARKRGEAPKKAIKQREKTKGAKGLKSTVAVDSNERAGEMPEVAPGVVPGAAVASMLTQDEVNREAKADARLLRRSIRERWAVEMLAKAKTPRDFATLASLLVRMEEQNQRDELAQIQNLNDAARLNEANRTLAAVRDAIADARRDPEFFDRLHAAESSSVRVAGRLGVSEFRRAVAIVRPSGGGESTSS